jgi:hypothetical protein
MSGLLRTVVAFQLIAPLCAMATDDKVLLELNSADPADSRCRLSFVIENKSVAALDSIKLDLVAFAIDGAILRRLIVEMGPLRAAKTMVRVFAVDAECRQLGAILVNDVTACAPAEPGTCLDALVLTSRLKELRLYK